MLICVSPPPSSFSSSSSSSSILNAGTHRLNKVWPTTLEPSRELFEWSMPKRTPWNPLGSKPTRKSPGGHPLPLHPCFILPHARQAAVDRCFNFQRNIHHYYIIRSITEILWIFVPFQRKYKELDKCIKCSFYIHAEPRGFTLLANFNFLRNCKDFLVWCYFHFGQYIDSV